MKLENYLLIILLLLLLLLVTITTLLLLVLDSLHGNMSSMKARTFMVLLTSAWFWHIVDAQWIFPEQINYYVFKFMHWMGLPRRYLLGVSDVVGVRWWLGLELSPGLPHSHVAFDYDCCLEPQQGGWVTRAVFLKGPFFK